MVKQRRLTRKGFFLFCPVLVTKLFCFFYVSSLTHKCLACMPMIHPSIDP